MGADGGLSWVFLRDLKHEARAKELLSGLGLYGFHGDLRDESWEWLQENPLSPLAIVLPYGTDMDHWPDAADIRDLLDHQEEELCSEDVPRDITFEGLALDVATRPMWRMWGLTKLERLVIEHCSWRMRYAFNFNGYKPSEEAFRTESIVEGLDSLGAIRNMRVRDWYAELRVMVDWKNYESVETWT